MRKSTLLLNHFTKSLALILLFTFISLGTIGGCNNNSTTVSNQALTENNFAEDPSLRGNAEGGVVVMFLEHPESDTPPNDTGIMGRDTIPMRYDRPLDHNFYWEDDDQNAEHFMELEDEQGNQILTIGANGECASAVIPSGNYPLCTFTTTADKSSAILFS